MQLGQWRLDTISGGAFRLDGGAMFGVVPKPLWEKVLPCDELNRIPLSTNCVLGRDGRRTVLIDTGYGPKLTAKQQEIYTATPGEPLLASLAELNVRPEDIDTVVLSHLHFDHAGGGVRLDDQGQPTPTFPNARYVAQRGEWNDALGGAAELAGSYPLDNLTPIEAAGQLDRIDGEVEIVSGLRAMLTPGHTAWHQSLVFSSRGQTAIYLGDLCPMTYHLRSLWCMAYDVHVLETRRRKPAVLGQAADENWLVLLDHDPALAACRLQRDARREFRVVETIARL